MTRFVLGLIVGILLGRWRRQKPITRVTAFHVTHDGWDDIPPPDAPAAYWTLVARA